MCNDIKGWNDWQKRSFIKIIKDLFNDLLDETKGFKFQIICQKSC